MQSEFISGMANLKKDKLQAQIRDILLEQIKNNAFPDGKLPTETKLAKILGVSRATISITLASMEQEGIVVRRHGSATYVNNGYGSIHSLITQGIGVYELLAQNGYTPSLLSNTIESFGSNKIEKEIIEKLHLGSEDKIYLIKRIFMADESPAIMTEEFIPQKFLIKELDMDLLPNTIYQLSENFCISPIEFTLVDIIPYLVDDFIREALKCDANDRVLLTEETHLNNKSIPMIFSRVFSLDKYVRFQAIRIRQ